MNKKYLWLFLALASVTVLFFIGSHVSADTAGIPFSLQSDTTAQAWYDETWQANGFYNLRQISASPQLEYYADTNNPTTPYDGPLAGPDLVITEWQVTGHVHFSSNL